MTIKTLTPSSVAFEHILKHAVAPRPICFASTIDKEGNINLSPFSYFNIVSHNPAICVFSPLRRMRDGTTKHTLENIKEVPEVVINIVNYNLVQQQSLASTEYGKGIDEFVKAGLTPIPATMIRPPRVAESPVQLECKVKDVISFGDTPGAGNMVLAEVLLMHIKEEVFGEDGEIDQAKLDLVARLGGDWYCRVDRQNLFEVAKPLRKLGIGVDQVPRQIRQSTVLTGNHLGQLGNIEQLPNEQQVDALRLEPEIRDLLNAFIGDRATLEIHLHRKAAELLDVGDVEKAWKVLLL
ncbi:flavin reductase [Olivibacter sp. SDN3]|uniref:flavin reductase family protein n=1 Tax=Olivibacter sp. SDN3 TaxID=2764720 RepID=UPI0016513069|nr:flavin reductase family protein [Olivibacter sp. SDN3]QNL48346.1 flavin reductase [Olivibacter sp. SDN3]